MGNSLGMRKRSTKVMKISGESFKLKTPVRAGSVLENHPGHVLLESESVKHYGVRAKPLEPQQELKPKRLYFLVELPKMPPDPEDNKAARRVRSASGIQMSAKDRLESLMLARRSSSDLYIMKPASASASQPTPQGVRVRMRLPKAEVERLMAESKDGSEVAEKIVGLCMANGGGSASASASNGGAAAKEPNNFNLNLRRKQVVEDEDGDEEVKRPRIKPPRDRQKRVGFLPITEGEIHLAVAS